MISYHIIVLGRLLMPSHSHIHISFLILPRLNKTKASLCPSSYLKHRKTSHCNIYVFIYFVSIIIILPPKQRSGTLRMATWDESHLTCVCVCVCVCVLCMRVCFSSLMISVCMSCFTCFTRLSWTFAHTQTNINQPQWQIQNSFTQDHPDERPNKDLNKKSTYIHDDMLA